MGRNVSEGSAPSKHFAQSLISINEAEHKHTHTHTNGKTQNGFTLRHCSERDECVRACGYLLCAFPTSPSNPHPTPSSTSVAMVTASYGYGTLDFGTKPVVRVRAPPPNPQRFPESNLWKRVPIQNRMEHCLSENFNVEKNKE